MKHLLIAASVAAVLLFVGCDGDSSPGAPAPTVSVTLSTPASSTIAAIVRIPDKATYFAGDTVLVIAKPAIGYACTGWSGDATAPGDTLKVVVTRNMVVFADFINVATGKKTFSITPAAENGRVTLLPATGAYDSGATVFFVAQPDYGFLFSGWEGLFTGADSAGSFPVTRSGVLRAKFAVDPKAVFATITISPVPVNGAIAFKPAGYCTGGACRFQPGSRVIVTAVPKAGYALSGWTGEFKSHSKLDTLFSYKIDSNVTAGATFDTGPGGLVWTQRVSGTESGLVSVASGKGMIVVTGNNGNILTSTDGTAWTKRTSGVDACINQVIWTGSLFIAVGDSGTIFTSADGATWSLKNKSPDYNLQSIAWNGKLFVAVGGKFIHSGLSTTRIMTSADGTTWKPESGGHGIFFNVTWNGTIFLAAGFNYDYSTVADMSNYVAYASFDGTDWEVLNVNVASHAALTSAVFDGRKFVVVGGSRNTGEPFASIYTTTSVVAWNAAGSPNRNTLERILFTGTDFIAVGRKGTIIASDTSARRWTARNSGTTLDLFGIGAGATQLVAVGESGTILTSPYVKRDEAAAFPMQNHPVAGRWSQDRETVTHANGTVTTTPKEMTVTQIYSITGDNNFTLALGSGTEYIQSLGGTWSIKGDSLVLASSEFGSFGFHYSIAGNAMTLAFPDTADGEKVVRKGVFLRL